MLRPFLDYRIQDTLNYAQKLGNFSIYMECESSVEHTQPGNADDRAGAPRAFHGGDFIVHRTVPFLC